MFSPILTVWGFFLSYFHPSEAGRTPYHHPNLLLLSQIVMLKLEILLAIPVLLRRNMSAKIKDNFKPKSSSQHQTKGPFSSLFMSLKCILFISRFPTFGQIKCDCAPSNNLSKQSLGFKKPSCFLFILDKHNYQSLYGFVRPELKL